eukprot:jgi/Hompol1/6333/HPOL_001501-RA
MLRISRLTLFGVASTTLSAAVVANAFVRRNGQFFPACVHITQSGGSLMVLSSMAIYVTIVVGRLLQMALFGELRAIEVEHLYERSWFSIMDTCLAMTIFRDEFDMRFISLFVILQFAKVFHWICADRVDYMEQLAELSLSFHVRMIATFVGLTLIDLGFLINSVNASINSGPTAMAVFAFEYTILLTLMISTFAKYILHTIDLRSANPWEEKSMYFFHIDLLVDFVKLVSYSLFFAVIIHYYGIPLHIVRDLYMTLRSFIQRCRDLIQYHRATANMQQRYPNATEQELAASDRICIVCREEMIAMQQPAPGQNVQTDPRHLQAAKKLPCGHIFHFRCLRSWLERQQTCPTCRRSVLDTTPGPARNAPAPQPANGQGEAPAAAAPAVAEVHPQAPPHVPPQGAPPVLAPVPTPLQIAELLRNAQQNFMGHHQPNTVPDATVPRFQPTPTEGTSGTTDLSNIPRLDNVLANGMLFGNTPIFLTPLGRLPTLHPDAAAATVQPLILDHLTDEQLRAMEGNSRKAIIERLEALHRIQAQLTSVTTQLTQILQLIPEMPSDVPLSE